MRKKVRSVIAAVLSAGLMVSGMNCQISYAAETTLAEAVLTETASAVTASDEAFSEETVFGEIENADAAMETSDETESAGEVSVEETAVREEATTPEKAEVPEEAELTTFSTLEAKDILTAVDTYGNPYYPYQTADGNYVLFASADMDLSALTVTLNEQIVSADKGMIDDSHVLAGAFTENGSSVTLTDASGSTYTVSVMQSDLPSMHITLGDTDLATINAGSKDTKYSGNSITLYDPDGNSIEKTEGLEIKGRGNSTWDMCDKKPYQIKFDKKTSVLGMDKAKKWVLLANAFDDSLVRNAAGLDIASSLNMAFTSEYKYIDLWVDGEYLGNYMICEKCEIGSGRLELSDPDAVLLEEDLYYYAQEEFWTKDPATGIYFALKETNNSGNEETEMKNFTDKLDSLYAYISTSDKDSITVEGLSQYIDLESVVQYYLVTEFTYNIENWKLSHYWYQNGSSDVLHMGPVWDFDSSMGNKTNATTTLAYFASQHVVIKLLLETDAFSEYASDYYNKHKAAFTAAANTAKSLGNKLTSSAAMNYVRWDFLGKDCAKPSQEPYHSTYAEAVNYLSTWLLKRADAFCPAGGYTVVLSGRDIKITCRQALTASSMTVAIWSADNGQDDIRWLSMSKGSDGYWHAETSMSLFNDDGTFTLHFFNEKNTVVAFCNAKLKIDYSTGSPKTFYDDMQDENAWYYDAVAYVSNKGIMTGLSNCIFGPTRRTSRAQIAMILYRMAGSPEVEYQDAFSDVKEGEWYTDAVIWGYQNGVINGYENGKFGPSDQVTREQFATLLYRYMKAEKPEGNAIGSYPDAGNVSAFAKDAMNWAVSEGIITGKELGGTRRLMPQDKASRAEIAQMLTRL